MRSVGILETGAPPAPLEPTFGRYPQMIERILGEGFRCTTFNVAGQELPDTPEDCEAYVVTGSAADAFDDASWIQALKAFLFRARGRAPLVGICFGHQVMAEAFGGRVARADKGWGIGLHAYAVTQHRPWMDDEAEAFTLAASHRDQVVQPPPSAVVVAGSYFCPIAAIEYADFPAISFQAHPEFEPEFARALINLKKDVSYTRWQADLALQSLELPNDNLRVRRWIRRFLEDAVPR